MRITREDLAYGALGALVALLVDLTSFDRSPFPLMLLFTLLAFVFGTAVAAAIGALRRRLSRKKRP